MDRKASIKILLSKLSKEIIEGRELVGKIGVNAGEISEYLDIHRSNVSSYLNTLVKEAQALKITGRPVCFLDKEIVEQRINRVLHVDELVIDDLSQLILSTNPLKGQLDQSSSGQVSDVFTSLIGHNKSLIKQIKQAKAVIMYPPNGLHALIVGPTGVGKSLFAQTMYEYAKEMQVIKPEMDFIVFNCADYSNNPQLLFSQLFGYVKGAFSGAESDKPGLVEIADGSILFLDEIHRLPPEGQETLFNLMDHGSFRRLGETSQVRKIQVRIIGATTSNPNSILLKTFLRRIPLTIQIPGLDERSLVERITFISNFFHKESKNIGIPLKIKSDIVHALLLYECQGNIGQLKSDIKMMCALAYAEFINSTENEIEINKNHIKNQLRNYTNISLKYYDLLEEFINNNNNDDGWYRFDAETISNQHTLEILNEIENKFLYNSNQISEFINPDLVNYQKDKTISDTKNYYLFLNKIVEDNHFAQKIFNETISNKILKITDRIFLKMDRLSMINIDKNLLFIILSIHLHFLIKRTEMNIYLNDFDIESIRKQYSKEFTLSEEIAHILSKEIDKNIAIKETAYLSLIIHTLQTWQINNLAKVGIIICFREGKPNKILETARQLLGDNHALTFKYSPEWNSEQFRSDIAKVITNSNRGKGIILFCESSLVKDYATFIGKEKGIKIKIMNTMSTGIIIEAIRLASQPESSLDKITEHLNKLTPKGSKLDFHKYFKFNEI